MRTCPRCQGTCTIDTSENDDGTHMEDCWMCSATGEVEDGCYCAARSPYECCCGGWDDLDLLTTCGTFDTKDCMSVEYLWKIVEQEQEKK